MIIGVDVTNSGVADHPEAQAVAERYARRSKGIDKGRYHPLNPAVYMSIQERERMLIRLLRYSGLQPVEDKRLLEVGCGTGRNLLQFLKLGFRPENLVGNELLPERVEIAIRNLPTEVELLPGDATLLKFSDGSFDVVFQSMVFTSLLDPQFQEMLAARMWAWVKPGGGVIWYDFMFNNPGNPDVRGVSIDRVRELFPEGNIKKWRVTLAPPIARLVTKINPHLYGLFNSVKWFRTHTLCWIAKGA